MTTNLLLLPSPQLTAVLAGVSRILDRIARAARRQAPREPRSMNG